MKDSNPEQNLLDDAISAIKSDIPSHQQLSSASERVQVVLAQHSDEGQIDDGENIEWELNTLEQYIAAIPGYLDGQLSAAQKLLFEEESRHSLQLRRELNAARKKLQTDNQNQQGRPSLDSVVSVQRPHYLRWFSSAAAVFVVAVSAVWMYSIMPSLDQGRLLQVEQVDGKLYEVADGRLHPLSSGDWVDGQMNVRTSSGSTAMLRLDDDSIIELNHRTELSVTRRRAGNQINVGRGQIIVAASPQGSGHLDVVTNELVVSVKGTIFQVGHGAMGSSVAVIEGAVQVDQNGSSTALEPGDQMGSRTGLVSDTYLQSFVDQFDWSANAEEYLDMLADLDQLQEDIGLAMQTQDRFDTRLLQLVPEDTVAYMAVPNAPEKISEVYSVIRKRIDQSEHLSEHWQQITGSSGAIDQVMTWLDELGSHLGDETVLSLVMITGESIEGSQAPSMQLQPVLLSEVDASFQTSFEQLLQELQYNWVSEDGQQEFPMAIIDDPSQAQNHRLNFWINGDILVVSAHAEMLQAMESSLGGGASPFVDSDFYTLLFNQYSEGAQFLGAVDLKTLLDKGLTLSEEGSREAQMVGWDDVSYLIASRKQEDRTVKTTADILFGSPRHGVMAILSKPGPMGSLEFFSADSIIVNAMLFENPVFILDEIEKDRLQEIEATEEQDKVKEVITILREQVFPSLGGEIAIGLDGPALPTPAWKVVLEVYDEVLFQSNVETAIEQINRDLAASGYDGTFELIPEPANIYSGYRIVFPSLPKDMGNRLPVPDSINYAYVDGYMVITPNISMLRRSITQYHSGISLLMDRQFKNALPDDGSLNFSAITFSRLQRLIHSLARTVGGKMTEDQSQLMEQYRYNWSSFYSLSAGEDNIRFYNKGGSFFGASLSSIAGLYSMFGVIEGEGAEPSSMVPPAIPPTTEQNPSTDIIEAVPE